MFTCNPALCLLRHCAAVKQRRWGLQLNRRANALSLCGAPGDTCLSTCLVKGCNYTSVAATPDNKALYAAGSDRKLKELEDTAGTGTQITKELDTGCVLTSTVLPAGE